MPLFRKRSKAHRASPEQVIAGMRTQVFALDPASINVAPTPERPHVWGAVMETGYPEACATLLAIGDGSVSLYFSNGGGVIGAGEHAPVRAAASAWLDQAERDLPQLERSEVRALPPAGRVVFYALTFGGIYASFEQDEQSLGRRASPLSPLFYSGQDVITAIRELGLVSS